MVFLVRGKTAENFEERIETDRRETLMNKGKEELKIQGKSNNNNGHLLFYLFYKKLYFSQKHSGSKR